MIQTLYNRLLRPYLPEKWKVTDDIAVKTGALFDTQDEIDMEGELRKAMKQVIAPRDSVLIIGGGIGTSTVEASRLTGENGYVHTIEPVADNLNRMENTIRHNYTYDNITVTNGYVGYVTDESIDTYGEPQGIQIDPSEVDRYDVIVVDCEGSESAIVPELEYRDLVLESHEWDESPTEYIDTSEDKLRYVGSESPIADIWVVSK